MHAHANAEEDRPFDVMASINPRAPWRVTKVQALAGFKLKVHFADGTKGFVDMSALVQGHDAGVFASLQDEALFKQVRVELGVVTWPGDIDLAPDAMHDAIQQHGEWVIS